MSNDLVHTRYVAGSLGLQNFLKELGYEEVKVTGRDLDKITEYRIKGTNKVVRSSFHELVLINLVKVTDPKTFSSVKEEVAFKGYTVHDELLKFFSKRNVDDNPDL